MTNSASAAAPRRARLGPYALWQFGDYLLQSALIQAILFGLIGVILIKSVQTMDEIAATMHLKPPPLEVRLSAFRQFLYVYCLVAPIIALSGIVSNDRAMGYVRFLFSKPVGVVRYYAQAALVRFAGYLLLGALFVCMFRLFVPVGIVWQALAAMALSYLIVGGLVFAVSCVSRHDGIVVMVVLLIAASTWASWEHAAGIRWLVPRAFPPIQRLELLSAWAVGLNMTNPRLPPVFPTSATSWLAGYAVACVLLGIIALRYRSITKP